MTHGNPRAGENPESRLQRWNKRYAAREMVWSKGPNLRFASEVVNLEPGRALDVACGEGRNALWLAERGWSVTGIDFSEVAINKARQIAGRRGVTVDWLVEDVSTCSLPKNTYDLVLVMYLHTDAAERKRWLASAVASVKPSGTFIYIGHDPGNIEHGVGGPQNPDALPGVEEIRIALEGYRIDIAQVVDRPVVNEPGHGAELTGVALDTLVRARRR